MNKIRIMVVGMDTHLGGIETCLLNMALNIDRDRFQYDFLAYDNQKPCFYEELSDLGCNFRFVRSRRKSWFGNKRDIKSLLEKEHYDIIHCHLNSLSYITPVLEGLKKGCKVIVQSHNGGTNSVAANPILICLNRFRLPYDRICCLAVSDYAGKWMFGKHRYSVMYNGVKTSEYAFSAEERIRIRCEFGLDSHTEVLVNVGAFREQKNQSYLLEIFNAYHKSHDDSVLVMVGEGPLESRLKEKAGVLGISDHVVFTGRRSDIAALFSASDVLVLPSLYEGFPMVMIEAQSCGLRCVVSDTITDQACIQNCEKIPLDSGLDSWVKAIEARTDVNREECHVVMEKAGLDINSTISRLEMIYTSLIGME